MKPSILLRGEDILLDENLLATLRKIANVLMIQTAGMMNENFNKKTIDLLVFESSENWENDLKELRSLKKNYPEMIIIVINGGDSPDNVIRTFKMGVDDYFKKPVDAALLAERIEALLKSKL